MNLIDHRLNGRNARPLPTHWTQGGWTPEGMRARLRARMNVQPEQRANWLRIAYNDRRKN